MSRVYTIHSIILFLLNMLLSEFAESIRWRLTVAETEINFRIIQQKCIAHFLSSAFTSLHDNTVVGVYLFATIM